MYFFVRALVAATGLISTAGMADTIVLENGDRLSGTLLRMEAASLWIETSYAGKIKLPRAQIAQIETDVPVRVQLADGTELDGQLQAGDARQVRIRIGSLAEAVPLGLDRIEAINPPPNPDKTVIKGRVSAGGSVTRGNTESQTLHLSGEMVARNPGQRVTLDADLNVASQNGVDTASNWRLGMKYDHFLKQRTYLYVNSRFDHDEKTDLDLRSTLGVGLGRQILDRANLKLSTEGALSLVNEDYGNNRDERFPGARFALKYEQAFLDGRYTVFHDSSVLLSLESIQDYLYQSRSGIRLPVTEKLSLGTQLNLDYDAVPAAGKETTDMALIFKLDYAL